MAEVYRTPGVYVEEVPTLAPSVTSVATAIPAFMGCTERGPTPDPSVRVAPIVKRIDTWFDYEAEFGGAHQVGAQIKTRMDGNTEVISGPTEISQTSYPFLLYYSMSLYFRNGGGSCYVVSVGNYAQAPVKQQFSDGISRLEAFDEPTLIAMPDAVNLPSTDYYALCQEVLNQCEKLGDRFAIFDILSARKEGPENQKVDAGGTDDFREHEPNTHLQYGAVYYPDLNTSLPYVIDESKVEITQESASNSKAEPRKLDAIRSSDTALYNRIKAHLNRQRVTLPPSSAIAGVYARVDRERGVWKAPANVGLNAVIEPAVNVSNDAQKRLNVDENGGKSINVIRRFTGRGTLVWGARTLATTTNGAISPFEGCLLPSKNRSRNPPVLPSLSPMMQRPGSK